MAQEDPEQPPVVVTDPVDFHVLCPCEDGCSFEAPLFKIEGGSLEAWKAVLGQGRVSDVACPECRCRFNLVDQGDAIGQTQVHKAH